MCKHVVLIPMKTVDAAMQKKTCKPVMFSRIWLATRRALSLEHSHPHHFACCQWRADPRPSLSYLIYRWLLFLSVVSVGVASFACQRLPRNYSGPVKRINYLKWFIYFTNWGYMLVALQCGLSLMVVHRYRALRNLQIAGDDDHTTPRRRRMPLLCRFYWLSHTVATDLAFVITLIYWTLVHDPKVHEVNALNILVHGGNSLVMVCELLTTAHPVKVAHALYGAAAGLLYGIFSALYWGLGGTDRLGSPAIYPSLDWSKPGSALGFVTLCAVVLVTAHGLASGVAAIRGRLANRLLPSSSTHAERLTLPTH